MRLETDTQPKRSLSSFLLIDTGLKQNQSKLNRLSFWNTKLLNF